MATLTAFIRKFTFPAFFTLKDQDLDHFPIHPYLASGAVAVSFLRRSACAGRKNL